MSVENQILDAGSVPRMVGPTWIQMERDEAIRDGLFVCYECKDDRCGNCVGVPCMCQCPIPAAEPEYSI